MSPAGQISATKDSQDPKTGRNEERELKSESKVFLDDEYISEGWAPSFRERQGDVRRH